MLSPSALSTTIPHLEIVWSSTTLAALKKCPRYYQYSILEGWSSSGSSIDINFGLIYHSALEKFQRVLAEGYPHDVALREAIRLAMIRSKDIGLPSPSESAANKSRPNLIRSIIWHCEHYLSDSLEQVILQDGTPAVELSFAVDLGIKASSGESFVLSGHLDRVVKFQGHPYVSDYKTTKATLGENYYASFDPDNQMSCYTIGGKIAFGDSIKGVVIDAAQIAVGL